MTEAPRSRWERARGYGPLLLLFWCDALALKLLDAVATGGFLDHAGIEQLPWMWSAEMLMVVILAGGWLNLADRWPRRSLVLGQFLVFGAGYGLGAAMLITGIVPANVVYIAIFVLSAQQSATLTGTLWMMAADMIQSQERAEVMPPLALGDSIGRICGYLASSALALWIGASAQMDARQLAGTAAFCVLGALVVRRFDPSDFEPPPTPRPDQSLRLFDRSGGAGLRWLRSQPTFLLLTVAVAGNWAAMTGLIFYRIDAMDSAMPDSAQFRALYAGFGMILLILVPFGQALLSRWLARLPVRRAFLALPIALLLSAALTGAFPGLTAALLTSVLFYLVSAAWDDPARYLLLAEAPTQLRGRLTALIDTHAFAAGSLVGALALAGVTSFSASTVERREGVLVVVAVFAIMAAWAGWRLRSSVPTKDVTTAG